MKTKENDNLFINLPVCTADYIRFVIKKMRWQRKARGDVQAELIGHFEDALKDCRTNEEKEKKAAELIADFGDAKILAALARRAKKRCRPLWQKVLIRSLQALEIIVLYIIICAGYIGIGKPNISVNYMEWLNDYVCQGRDESLNCAPMLKKAAQLVAPMPGWINDSNANWHWPSDFNETQLQKLEGWLAQNTEAFEALRKTPDTPYYWNTYDINELIFNTDIRVKGILSPPMKELSKYRQLVRAMGWQIRYSAYKNDIEKAIDDAIGLCGFGSRMEGNGLIVEQLVGVAIEALGYSAIFDILDKTTLSTEQLEKVQNFLQQHYKETIIDIRADKACLYDFVQHNFTDDGKGGGRPIRMGVAFAGKNRTEIFFNTLSFNLPDKKEIIKEIDRVYETYQQEFNLVITSKETMEEQYCRIKQNSPVLLQMLTPAVGKIALITWRFKTHRDGLIATLAVLRYHKQTGRYPDSLDELLNKGFINRMPFDAYRNGSLTYRKTENNFILYSFGEDFDDDGGTPSRWGAEAQGGDQVFWPVVKIYN